MVSFRFLTATLSTAALCEAVTSYWRSYELGPLQARTPDLVTKNVLVLRQTEVSPDTKASRLRRRMTSLGDESRGISKRGAAQAPLTEVPGVGYSADVSIDGNTYPVVIAIVSSDLWVAAEGFQCLDDDFNKTKPQDCAFGPNLFKGTPSGGMLSDQNFFVQYSDKEVLWGTPAVAKVEIAGASIETQVIGLVNSTRWAGDNKTVGQLGLGYPITASTYNGPWISPANDSPANRNKSDLTVLQSIMKKDSSLGAFAIAQPRGSKQALLSFGGIPDVPNDGKFAKVPIRPMKYYYDTEDMKEEFGYYAILPDAYEYEGYKKPVAIYTNSTMVQDDKFESPVTFDIDYPTMNLHIDIADAVARLFDPPAVMNNDDDAGDGNIWAQCNAKVPKFAVKIGGQSFPVSKDNMLLPEAVGGSYVNKTTKAAMCRVGVQGDGARPPFSFGFNFMKNVVTVFDTGAGEMRFAAVPE